MKTLGIIALFVMALIVVSFWATVAGMVWGLFA